MVLVLWRWLVVFMVLQAVGRIGEIWIQAGVLVEDCVIGATVGATRCGRGFGDSGGFSPTRMENNTSTGIVVIRTHRDYSHFTLIQWQLRDTWLMGDELPAAARRFFGWGHLLELADWDSRRCQLETDLESRKWDSVTWKAGHGAGQTSGLGASCSLGA